MRDVLTRDHVLSASAPPGTADEASDDDAPPLTMLDVLEQQALGLIQQGEALLTTVALMRRMTTRPRPESPDPPGRPATFGRPASPDDETSHG